MGDIVNYLKSTNSCNKAKFPIKKSKKPLGVCRYCSDAITKENALYYTGGLGMKNVCRDCLKKQSLKYAKKKAERIKASPLW